MIFRFITSNLFKALILIIGSERAKTILWNLLDKILRQTYTLGGEGEDICWLQFKSFLKSPTIIDVGANIGKASERFLKIFPNSRIYSIEPIPDFFKLIDDKRIESKHNLALSNKKKAIKIYRSGLGAKAAYKKTINKKCEIYNINAISGDQFVKENQIKKVNIIKIDTDGFDLEVIQGFLKVIKKDRPIIQFELSKWWLLMGFTLKQAEDLFIELNYDLFSMTDNGLETLKIPIPDSLFVTKNILAFPKEITPDKLNAEVEDNFEENLVFKNK